MNIERNEYNRNVWRVGAKWGEISVLDLFCDYGIAFFWPEAERIGDWSQVGEGDLAMIGDDGYKVVALARITSKAMPIEELGAILGVDINEYCDAVGFKIASIHFLKETDVYNSSDYKRFYQQKDEPAQKARDLFNRYDTADKQGKFKIYSRTVSLFRTQADNEELHGLYNGNDKYRIPIYQRPYSWGEKEIGRLFQDIARGVLNQEPLFMGTIQFSEPTPLNMSRTMNRYDVIDGQQRLTTFWILMRLLLLIGASKLSQKVDAKLLRTLVNKGSAQEHMNEFVEKSSSLEGIRNSKESSNIYLKNANLILEEIEELLKPAEGKPQIDCESLVAFLTDNVRVVVIETHAGLSKTLQIFNVINTTGLDLNGSDIFKIRFFEFLTDKRKKLDVAFDEITGLYRSIEDKNKLSNYSTTSMQEILGILQTILVSRYDLSNTLFSYETGRFFDNLFDSLLCINYAEHFSKDVAQRILDDDDEYAPLTIHGLRKLIECRYAFADRYCTKDKTLFKDAFMYQMMWYSRYGRFWPLPIVFMYRYGDSHLDVFYFALLRMVLCYSMVYGRTVYEAIGVIHSVAKCLYAQDDFVVAVKKLDDARLGKYAETKKAFLEYSIAGYPTWKGIACRLSEYLKYGLPDRIETNVEAMSLLFETQIDIEHIQSYNDSDTAKRDAIQREWENYLNGIGNLAMLEYNINRSISNGTFNEKLSGYKDSKYHSIKELLSLSDWTLKDCIRRRDKEVNAIMSYLFD